VKGSGATVKPPTDAWIRENLERVFAAIPDVKLFAEAGRRRAKMRTSYTGGVLWKQHNPDTRRCRCVACTGARLAAAAK
jgi:hypothetical protein